MLVLGRRVTMQWFGQQRGWFDEASGLLFYGLVCERLFVIRAGKYFGDPYTLGKVWLGEC